MSADYDALVAAYEEAIRNADDDIEHGYLINKLMRLKVAYAGVKSPEIAATIIWLYTLALTRTGVVHA